MKVKTKLCSHCGAEMPEAAFYCSHCGNVFVRPDERFETTEKSSNSQKEMWRNKWVALLLCIFFCGLGIHRFYEGKVITGILYIFILGYFGIGWIIDIVRIALKPNLYRRK